MVVGEVVPKNLAIEKADVWRCWWRLLCCCFIAFSEPFVYVVERSAPDISRALGVSGHAGGGHSTEELKFIVESSRKEGHLEGFEEVAIQKLLDLQDRQRQRGHDTARGSGVGSRRR